MNKGKKKCRKYLNCSYRFISYGRIFLKPNIHQALDQVGKELSDISDLAKNSREFSSFLKDPVIARKKKEVMMKQMLEKMGVSELTVKFLCVLASNGRLNQLQDIKKAFSQLIMARNGEIEVVVSCTISLHSCFCDWCLFDLIWMLML